MKKYNSLLLSLGIAAIAPTPGYTGLDNKNIERGANNINQVESEIFLEKNLNNINRSLDDFNLSCTTNDGCTTNEGCK